MRQEGQFRRGTEHGADGCGEPEEQVLPQPGPAVEETQHPFGGQAPEQPGEEVGAVDASGVQGAQHHGVHGQRATPVGRRQPDLLAVTQRGGDGLALPLDGGEGVAGRRPGGTPDGADAVHGGADPPGEPRVGHGDDARFDGTHLERSEAQDVPGVLLEGRLVLRAGQRGPGELGVLDERVLRAEREYVSEGESVGGLRDPEVHQLHDLVVEGRGRGADEPASEVLQQGAAGRRQRTGGPGVEQVPAPQCDAVPSGGDAQGFRAAGHVAHRLRRRLHQPHMRKSGQPRSDQGFETVRAEHPVAQRVEFALDHLAVPAVDAQPPPGRDQGVVEVARALLPEAPGAFGRAQRRPRRVHQRHREGTGGAGSCQRVRERQSRRPAADDHDVGGVPVDGGVPETGGVARVTHAPSLWRTSIPSPLGDTMCASPAIASTTGCSAAACTAASSLPGGGGAGGVPGTVRVAKRQPAR